VVGKVKLVILHLDEPTLHLHISRACISTSHSFVFVFYEL
jgi:hypothetical protein